MGIKVPALQIAPNRFVGVASISALGISILDPKQIDTATDADCNKAPRLKAAKEQRGANQRKFDKKRVDRACEYARYIMEVDSGTRMGGYPPITFWCKDGIPFVNGELDIPGASILTANDGETQLHARYILAKENPDWLDSQFAFTLATESTCEEASQTLHDMNHYASPVSEKDTASLNVEGALTKAINQGVVESGRTFDIINSRGKDKTTGDFYTTSLILLYGAIGAAVGEEAFTKSPTRWIQDLNGQFVALNGKAENVKMFVSEVLRLDALQIKTITSAHMMALGVKFNQSKRIAAPLSLPVIEMLEKSVKGEKSRISVQAVAREIYYKLA